LTDTEDRRQADIRLRDALVAEDCDGRAWRRFSEELSAYGYMVVMSWLKSRKIFAECASRGFHLGSAPRDWEDDDLFTLTTDTVVNAVEHFRSKAVLGGGWDPEGRASLTTYFITGCVFAFPNVYRAWRRDFEKRMDNAARTVDTDELMEVAATSPDPGEVVTARFEAKRALASIKDDNTRRAVILREAGYSVDEVADWLGTTPGSVRGALQRVRKGRGTFDQEGGAND